MKTIELSIIIPTYNTESSIERCLNSLLYSGYPTNTELILIDDTSTDNTVQIIQNFIECNEHNFTQIKFIANKTNNGVATCRNTGLDSAAGKHICFVDADDIVKENGIKKLYEISVSSQADIIIGSHETRTENNTDIGIHSMDNFNITAPFNQDILCDMFYVAQIGNNVWNKIYKKEICARFSITEYYEDYPFVLNTLMNCKHIIHIDEITYTYIKQQSSSLSGIRYNENQPGWFAQVVEHYMKKKAIEILSQEKFSKENLLKADNLFVNRKAKKALQGNTPEDMIINCPQYIESLERLKKANS